MWRTSAAGDPLVLDGHRDRADPSLTRLAGPFMRINPDHLTLLAFILAVLAGYLLHMGRPDWTLPLAAIVIFMSALFDALDGKVAKATGRASPRGDLLDHTLDRYADLFILGGIMFGPYCRPWIGFLGVIGVLMASYMGTQAHALTRKRDYGGLVGRADRLVLLVVLIVVQYIVVAWDVELWSDLTALELLMMWFAVAGQLTAAHRGIRAWRILDGPSGEPIARWPAHPRSRRR